MENLNEFERAALFYYVYSGSQNKAFIYQLARGLDSYNKLTDKSKKTITYNWFKSQPVRDYIKKLEFERERQKQETEQNILNSVVTETTEPGTAKFAKTDVNFLNRDQFLEYLNQKANSQTDEKLQNETLKMLSDNLRYKDGENETAEIQRFYTPVCCKDCEIYIKCSGCLGCSGSGSGK